MKTSRPGSTSLAHRMERFSTAVTEWTGSTSAFLLALAAIVVWLVTGPLQRAQNKSAKAVALKLNELIAAVEGASNRLIDVEELSEDELGALHEHFRHLVRMAKRDSSLTKSHSIEEAKARHEGKLRRVSRVAPSRRSPTRFPSGRASGG